MKRRKFIVLAATGTATLSLPLACTSQNITYDPLLAQPQTLAAIMEGPDIGKIGEAYLNDHSRENTSKKLVKQLRKSIPKGSKDLSDALTLQIQDDFKNERTVMIDGWVLSQTEARQSALFFIAQPK
jgi:hypothetical protein